MGLYKIMADQISKLLAAILGFIMLAFCGSALLGARGRRCWMTKQWPATRVPTKYHTSPVLRPSSFNEDAASVWKFYYANAPVDSQVGGCQSFCSTLHCTLLANLTNHPLRVQFEFSEGCSPKTKHVSAFACIPASVRTSTGRPYWYKLIKLPGKNFLTMQDLQTSCMPDNRTRVAFMAAHSTDTAKQDPKISTISNRFSSTEGRASGAEELQNVSILGLTLASIKRRVFARAVRTFVCGRALTQTLRNASGLCSLQSKRRV